MNLSQFRDWLDPSLRPEFDRALAAYARQVRASERATVTLDVREQVAQEIRDEADNYAGDMAREFGEIFAKVALGGDRR